jgi:hypothetical protein
MAVIRDATGAGATTTGAACTASHTIVTPSLSTVVFAFVAISVSTSSTSTTCTATYGGTAMTQLNLTLLGSGTSRSAYAIFYLFNPPKGAQNCVVTPGGTSTKAGVRVATVSYNGVNSVGTAQTAAALTISATSVANGYNIFGHINGVTMTTPSQSQRVLLGSAVGGVGDFLLVQDAAGTGSNITFSVGGTATTPGTFGVALSPTPKASTVTDTMDTPGSGVGDVGNWYLATADATVAGGQLRFTPSTPDVLSFGTIGASGTHPQANVDLTDSTWSCEVVQIVDGSGTVVNSFLVQLDFTQDNELVFAINPGANGCYCAWYSGGVYQGTVAGSSAFTYNPTVHRYFQFRETSGTVYWEYSTDRSTWVTVASMATPFSVRGVRPWWECYYATGTTVTVPAFIIDNVNVAAIPKASSFVEDFSTSTRWTLRGTAVVTGGQLSITPATTGSNDAFTNGAVGHLDLANSSIMFNVVGMVAADGCLIYLADTSQQNTFSFYKWTDGNLYSCERVAGVDSNTNPVSYDPVAHKYWRIRESGGTVYWETSPTGIGSWTVQRSKAWAVPSINSFFIFPTTTNGSGGLPFVIEDINVTPAPASSLSPPVRRPNYGSLLQL